MAQDFNQAMADLAAAKPQHAKQPDASNAAPLDAWRKVVDAQSSEQRGGEATPQPFHTSSKANISAIDAWRAAIKPAA